MFLTAVDDHWQNAELRCGINFRTAIRAMVTGFADKDAPEEVHRLTLYLSDARVSAPVRGTAS